LAALRDEPEVNIVPRFVTWKIGKEANVSIYRNALPQLGNEVFLSDGGMETTLVFHEGLDLPCFAAFDLLKTEKGVAALRRYYETYAGIAAQARRGFILETPTWRANADWGTRLGYGREELRRINQESVSLMEEVRTRYELLESPIVISGCVGPRGDGYRVDSRMTAVEAAEYHTEQISVFAQTAADVVTAHTLTYADEAIGIAVAASRQGIPSVISFTTEVDGHLPSGQSLRDAIEEVDAATSNGPAYYMINCAHPTHFMASLHDQGDWRERIRGVRANASRRTHAELDASPNLDSGDPQELGAQYRQLFELLPGLTVLGGCCGTDHRHIEQASKQCPRASTPVRETV